ncbi:MAG: discoidin domain-containing protein, partial [Acutalibacteraceae bacterium]
MHLKLKFKKILCLALSVLMLTSFLQTAVSATDSDGTGSEDTVTFTALDGTAGASSAGGTENFDKLIDGDTDTKWCVTSFSSAYIVIEASSAISVSGYQMTTGNDTASETSRNPEDWTLYGCNDYNAESKEGTWEVIHEVIGDPVLQAVNTTTYSFACDKTETPYKYFKLLITKNSGSQKCMQLSEFNFTYCEHETTVLNTRDADCTNYGYVEKNCSVCGLTYIMITSEALGHSWVTLSTTDATCTESGKLNQECSVCKETQTVNDPSAPALGHTWVTLSTTDATCTESGKLN